LREPPSSFGIDLTNGSHKVPKKVLTGCQIVPDERTGIVLYEVSISGMRKITRRDGDTHLRRDSHQSAREGQRGWVSFHEASCDVVAAVLDVSSVAQPKYREDNIVTPF
jgi:hypothetical protein